MQTRAERFRRLREKTGMTQAEFAEFVGVTDQSIRNWEAERYKRPIARRTLVLVSKACDASISWLVTGKGPAPAGINDKIYATATLGKSSMGSPRNPAPPDILHATFAREAVTAGIEQAYLLLLNRAPNEGEKELLAPAALAMLQARHGLAGPHRQEANDQNPQETHSEAVIRRGGTTTANA